MFFPVFSGYGSDRTIPISGTQGAVMTVFFTQGDLILPGAHTTARGVNCSGMMGAGITREFRRRYPQMFSKHRRRCFSGELRPGDYFLDKTTVPWVLNLATQDMTAGATLAHVRSCLECFTRSYSQEGIKSLSMPRITEGLGGPEWDIIRDSIEHVLGPLPLDVYVYERYVRGLKGYEPPL
jgi:O-acetyl-ADP-ribose deacetylase (regulator of RNase III)